MSSVVVAPGSIWTPAAASSAWIALVPSTRTPLPSSPCRSGARMISAPRSGTRPSSGTRSTADWRVSVSVSMSRRFVRLADDAVGDAALHLIGEARGGTAATALGAGSSTRVEPARRQPPEHGGEEHGHETDRDEDRQAIEATDLGPVGWGQIERGHVSPLPSVSTVDRDRARRRGLRSRVGCG